MVENWQQNSHVRTLNVYLIFTASGAAALIYQVIWARWLGLVFGNTAVSVSIVLASFMLGLALGSWLVGRSLHRISDPMRTYAYIELSIGVFALCLPLLTMAVDMLFNAIVTVDASPLLSLSVRAALSFLLLVFPTTLMGATLPLLTDFFRRDPRHTQSWKVGLLYAANTFGAALGVIFASFVLIELIGIKSTTFLAAALNFLVAFIGIQYAKSTHLGPAELFIAKKNLLDPMGKLTLGALAASGAIALASEVLWTRALEILIGNSSYAFGFMLVVYLLGIAAGSWAMSLVVNRLRSLPLWLATLLLGMGLWTVVSISLFDLVSRNIAAHAYAPVLVATLFASYVKASSLLFPLAFLSGAIFPIATRILDPKSEDAKGLLIARAYAWNTMGAVLGSIVAGFGIAALFDYFQAIYFLAALYGGASAAVVIIAALSEWKNVQKPFAITLAALSLALIVLSAVPSLEANRFADRIQKKYNGKVEAIFHKPGIQGVTSVLKKSDQKLGSRLLVNGTGMTVKITDTKMMAHLPMLLHPAPENTLVICFGMGTTYRSAISYGGRVTVVELVDEVFEAFDYFYEDADRVRAYPKGRMITNDGRNFLKLTRERYDVITIDPPPPVDAAGVNHLYSKEFLELARTRLKKGGIMAHWIPYPTAKAGVDDWQTFKMLVDTFSSVYPQAIALPGLHRVGLHVLGAIDGPIQFSEEIFRQRMSVEAAERDMIEWDQVPIDYLSAFRILRPADQYALLTTDDRPNLEFNLIRLWMNGTQKLHPNVTW